MASRHTQRARAIEDEPCVRPVVTPARRLLHQATLSAAGLLLILGLVSGIVGTVNMSLGPTIPWPFGHATQ